MSLLKRIKFSFLIIILFVVCCASHCNRVSLTCQNGGHNKFIVINNSNKAIKVYFYWDYPDTTCAGYNVNYYGKIIFPREQENRGVGISTCFEELLSNNKKQWIYFFDNDTLATLPWDTVRKTYRGVLERRLIDLDYLQQHNFKITYP